MKLKTYSLFAIVAVILAGCGFAGEINNQPPQYIFEAFSKQGASVEDVKAAMRSCGYKDLFLANDLTKAEVVTSEACMVAAGFKLDVSSYRPNNCYGPNSPYLCNKFFGGEKAKLQPVSKN